MRKRRRQLAQRTPGEHERALGDLRHQLRGILEGASLVRLYADRLGRLPPSRRRTHRHVDRVGVLLTHAVGHEHERSLARHRGSDRERERLRRILRKLDLPVHGLLERKRAASHHVIRDHAVRAAAVGERERREERVARRGEARRVRLHHHLRRDLRMLVGGAGGVRVVRDRRHAHLAHEFAEIERCARVAVRVEAAILLPEAERLEAAARSRAYPAEEVALRAAARLHSRPLQLAVDDRQEVVVEIVQRMQGVARLAEPVYGIGHRLVGKDVDAFVYHRHDSHPVAA